MGRVPASVLLHQYRVGAQISVIDEKYADLPARVNRLVVGIASGAGLVLGVRLYRRGTGGSTSVRGSWVPEQVALKAPSEYPLFGRRVPRVDPPAKAHGHAKFGIDIRLPCVAIAIAPGRGRCAGGYAKLSTASCSSS